MTREKRSVSLYGHRTSVALEPDFWDVIDHYVDEANISLASFIKSADNERLDINSDLSLAAYLRVWALHYAKNNLRTDASKTP